MSKPSGMHGLGHGGGGGGHGGGGGGGHHGGGGWADGPWGGWGADYGYGNPDWLPGPEIIVISAGCPAGQVGDGSGNCVSSNGFSDQQAVAGSEATQDSDSMSGLADGSTPAPCGFWDQMSSDFACAINPDSDECMACRSTPF